MIKLYISQPIEGKTAEDIEQEKQKALLSVKEKYGDDIEIIERNIHMAQDGKEALCILGNLIRSLSEANVVYFCKNWETEFECEIENRCALEYGNSIVIEDYR